MIDPADFVAPLAPAGLGGAAAGRAAIAAAARRVGRIPVGATGRRAIAPGAAGVGRVAVAAAGSCLARAIASAAARVGRIAIAAAGARPARAFSPPSDGIPPRESGSESVQLLWPAAAPSLTISNGARRRPARRGGAAAGRRFPTVLPRRKQLRLHDQRGKVVLLNFWATWCPPCVHEMPLLDQLYQTLRQRPFVLWAVAMQEGRDKVAPFIDQHPFQFTVLPDSDGAVSAR